MFPMIKKTVFYSAKWLGLFALARRIYRHRVRILCYHGFTLEDEHLCVPGLFIEPDVFQQRMDYLADKNYRVLPLHEAWLEIESGNIGADTVVLTIDDGFYSTLRLAAPVLAEHGFPATLYLTSYYFDQPCPIFTLTVDYLFFKSGGDTSVLQQLAAGFSDAFVAPEDWRDRDQLRDALKNYGQQLPDNEQREQLLQTIGNALGVAYQPIRDSRILGLVNRQEIAELERAGVDIQLHTHRHRFPTDTGVAAQELRDNRAALQDHVAAPLNHFCYPSGEWDEAHWPVLQEAGMLTATTCESGLVDARTPPLAMNRILDSARVSQIEYEAEVSGFNQLIRSLRGRS